MSSWVERLNEIHTVVPGQRIKTLTPEWYNARRGRLTSSVRARTIHHGKGFPALAVHIEEELSPDWTQSSYSGEHTEWGNEHEAGALASLELHTGHQIFEPGLLFHPTMPYVAGTPDGVAIAESGRRICVEIKCPSKPEYHRDNLYGGGKIKRQYWFQVQWEAWLLDAESIIFASYDPRQPFSTQLAVIDIPICLDTRRRFEQNALAFQRYFDGDDRPVEGRLTVMPGHIPEVF